MLSTLSQIHHYHRALVYGPSSIDLPVQLYAVGIEYRDQMSYDYDGLKRKNNNVVILQYGFSGGGILIHEDHEYVLGEQDLMLVRLPHRHRYRFLPQRYGGPANHWHFMFVLLTGALAVEACRQVQENQGPVLHLSEQTRMIQSMTEAIMLLREDQPISHWQASQMGYDMSMSLMDLSEGRGFTAGRQRHGMVGQVMDYCERHYAQRIGVDELSEVAGVTRYHLSRVFKAQTGLSPGEYLIQCRMQQAARMLLETDQSVQQIAMATGYQEANYFSKAFRKYYQKSPKQYRSDYVLHS